MTLYRNHAEEIADAMADDHRRVVAEPEPSQWSDLVAHLRARVAELEAERDAARKAGYDMARDDAAKVGWHLVRYEVAMGRRK